MSKVWLVTGSSRGLGRSIAKAVLEAGDSLVATARNPKALDDLKAKYGDRVVLSELDVTSEAQSQTVIRGVVERFGKLDVLVNNAGYGFVGAFEEMSDAQFRGQIDTNFWGVVNTTRAAVPFMRKQGFGHILQITSIGGRMASPGLSGYHAAKFAVEGLSESLAQELRPFGVKLTIVEPGGFRTDWAGASMAFADPIEGYESTVGLIKSYIQTHTGQESGDPDKAAQVILDLVNQSNPPLRMLLGSDAVAFLRRGYTESLRLLEENIDVSKSTDFSDAKASDTDHELMKHLP